MARVCERRGSCSELRCQSLNDSDRTHFRLDQITQGSFINFVRIFPGYFSLNCRRIVGGFNDKGRQ